MRLPARGIEALIRTRIEALLANVEELASILPPNCDRAAIVSSAIRKAKDFASLSAADLGLALNSFVSRISVLSNGIAITLHPPQLAALILGASMADSAHCQKPTITPSSVRMKQRG